MMNASGENLFITAALCLLAFSIPFPFIYSSLAMILLSLAWLWGWRKGLALKRWSRRWALWPWAVYYLLHAISFFYSENREQSAFDLQVKLGLLLLPVLVGSLSLEQRNLQKILASFCFGVSAVALIALVRSALIWEETEFSGIMFYHNLVRDFDANAVYMSWYTLVSIGLILLFPWSRPYPYLRIPLLVLQTGFLILLSSRMLLVLFLGFVIPLYFYVRIRHLRFTWPKFLGVSLVLGAALSLVILTDNPIRKRFVDILYNPEIVYLKDFSQVDESTINNTDLRLFLWKIGLENMNEQGLWAFGAGNGDVNALQNQKMMDYRFRNMDHPDPEQRSSFYNINLHNMFLQTLLMLGILGLIPFLAMVFLPWIVLPRCRLWAPFSVFLLTSFFFLQQESCLQSHAGVIFYSFFSSLFWAAFYTDKYAISKKIEKKMPQQKN